MIYPCPFCQTEVPETINNFNCKVHCCPCGIKFTVKDCSVNGWSFKVTLHEEFQLIFLKELLGQPEFSLWDKKQQILAFKFLPDITPQNAKEKVQLMLVFS